MKRFLATVATAALLVAVPVSPVFADDGTEPAPQPCYTAADIQSRDAQIDALKQQWVDDQMAIGSANQTIDAQRLRIAKKDEKLKELRDKIRALQQR